ncbi:MAG: PH domain-containing protein [Lautropia sp.]|nr:PH domain-containing protein [Lautropia sp.]
MAFILLIVFGGLPRRSLSLDEGGVFLKTTYYTKKVPFSKISSVQVGEECVVDFDFKRNGIGLPGLYSGWYVSNGLNYLVDFVNKPNICIYYNGSSEALALEVSNPSDLKGLIHD